MRLKSLEFLKDQKRRHINMANSMKVVYFDDELDEAIEELEALENRRCNNCKYVSSDTLGLIYCSNPKSPLSSCVFPIHPNFSCNKWEIKK